jgi:hypothetical protein
MMTTTPGTTEPRKQVEAEGGWLSTVERILREHDVRVVMTFPGSLDLAGGDPGPARQRPP